MKKITLLSILFALILLPLHGSVLQKLSTIDISYIKKPSSLTFDGKSFFITDRYDGKIFEISPAGKLINSFDSPGPFPSGITTFYNDLIVADKYEKKLYFINKKGEVLRVLPTPLSSPMGIFVFSNSIYVASERGKKIYRLSLDDGSIVDEFEAPKGINGLFIKKNGNFLLTSRIKDRVYYGNVKRKIFYYYIPLDIPYAWGIFLKKDNLYILDQARRKIYLYRFNPHEKWIKGKKTLNILKYRNGIYNYGPGIIKKVEIYVALPEDKYNQRIVSINHSHKPKILKDSTGQRYAYFVFKNIKPGKRVRVITTFKFYNWEVKSTIVPEFVKGEIPDEIKKLYLTDGEKYSLKSPYLDEIIKKIVNPDDDYYTKVRKIYEFIGEKITYELYGGWEPAPVVIKRGSGSCSEYSFSTIALLRKAGIPSRYVGSISERGDKKSYDDVFHRWVEVYFPNYGWIPVDSDAGDSENIDDRIFFFGGTKKRYLITTRHSGPSPYLGWDYNSLIKWQAQGRVHVYEEKIAEWDIK